MLFLATGRSADSFIGCFIILNNYKIPHYILNDLMALPYISQTILIFLFIFYLSQIAF